MTFILQKTNNNKRQQQGIETEEGITISYLSDIINCASILGMTLFGKKCYVAGRGRRIHAAQWGSYDGYSN